jgi:hypothetical protein
LIRKPTRESLQAALQTVGEKVGHGNQFDGAALSRKSVDDSSGAPAAATHKRQTNGRSFRSVHVGHDDSRQS